MTALRSRVRLQQSVRLTSVMVAVARLIPHREDRDAYALGLASPRGEPGGTP